MSNLFLDDRALFCFVFMSVFAAAVVVAVAIVVYSILINKCHVVCNSFQKD